MANGGEWEKEGTELITKIIIRGGGKFPSYAFSLSRTDLKRLDLKAGQPVKALIYKRKQGMVVQSATV